MKVISGASLLLIAGSACVVGGQRTRGIRGVKSEDVEFWERALGWYGLQDFRDLNMSTSVPSANPTQSLGTVEPTASPVATPQTSEPTASPVQPPQTSEPTTSPVQPPPETSEPTTSPVQPPPGTSEPTASPVDTPQTSEPTTSPIQPPPGTSEPTASPVDTPQTSEPTASPVETPQTLEPTASPVETPQTSEPTASPVETRQTSEPTASPVETPQTLGPTVAPVETPQTSEPTVAPVLTSEPTLAPIVVTNAPTTAPVVTDAPTTAPVAGGPLPLNVPINSPPLGSSDTTIFGRMVQSFEPSDCFINPITGETNRPYPGTGGNSTRFYEVIGPFQNPNADLTCFTVDIAPGDCISGAAPLVIIGAFTAFNPENIGEGYLGDISNLGSDTQFQMNVVANGEFFLVGQQVNDNDSANTGVGCVFTVTVSI